MFREGTKFIYLRFFVVVCSVFIFVGIGCSEKQSVPAKSVDKTQVADRIVKVVDGDTVHLMRGTETLKVRLQGIDAPEKEPLYPQALAL